MTAAFRKNRAAGTGGPRGSARLFLSCAAVLLVALMLNGGLTLGALRTIHADAVTSGMRVVGGDWALRIQGAIRFGKPIGQFYGLDATLAEIRGDLRAADFVALTLPDGIVVGSQGDPALAADVPAAVARRLSGEGTERAGHGRDHAGIGDAHYFVFPIEGRDGSWAGSLVLATADRTIARSLAPHLRRNGYLLALVAAAGTVALLLGLAALAPLRPDRPFPRLRLYAAPIAVLVLTQGVYSFGSVQSFREQYTRATAAITRVSADRLARDLGRLFDKGVRIDRLNGIEAPVLRIMDATPEITSMDILTPDGRALYRVGRDGTVSRDVPAEVADSMTVGVPLLRHDGGGGTGLRIGTLRAHLSEEAVAAGVRQRVLDAATIALTSALFVVELFILLTVLLRAQSTRPAAQAALDRTTAQAALDRATAQAEAGTEDRRHMLARPAAFLLLFGWALPLSFIPLRMRELYVPLSWLPEGIALALPISAEMLCALLTALVAGSLTDRRGWHVPFLGGVAVCVAGSALSAAAGSTPAFVAARALVGLGYGLAWMGIQGFIFLWAPAPARARGLSNLVAGIFAGHICGSAVGAMLAEQVGYTAVFAASGVLSALPALFAVGFMRAYLGRPSSGMPEGTAVPAPAAAAGPERQAGRPGLGRLLGNREFGWLLLGSVVPFSVAQVGLLYYTLPLHLSEQGVSQANIGRIMMIYGLSVIYLGPVLGRFMDRFERKKPFITLGGLLGGGGMAYLYFDDGLPAMMLSVFLLGMASCLAGTAQSAFALKLPMIHRYGTGRAMGVQRAADKLGQMMGPLVVGLLFTAVGPESGLAVTGLYYLLSTVAFMAIVREGSGTGAA